MEIDLIVVVLCILLFSSFLTYEIADFNQQRPLVLRCMDSVDVGTSHALSQEQRYSLKGECINQFGDNTTTEVYAE